MMDVVVPANMLVGSTIDQQHKPHASLSCSDLAKLLNEENISLIDLREAKEIDQHGTIEGIINIPYQMLDKALSDGGDVDLILKKEMTVVFICAYGERSSLALEKIREPYASQCAHLQDGFHDWLEQGYPRR